MSEKQTTNVLLVDDNQHVRSVVHAMINSLGLYDIDEVSHAAAAHDALRAKSSNVVIVSDQCQSLDGVGFVNLLRNSDDILHREVPIIVMTSETDKEQIAKLIDIGANAVLIRPFTAQDLQERIASVCTESIPLVRTKDYFGSDRRAGNDEVFGGAERRGFKKLMDLLRTGTRD